MKSWLCFFLVLPCLAQADGTHWVTESFDQGQGTPARHVIWSSVGNGKIDIVNDPVLGNGNAFKGNKIVGILPFATLTAPGDSITVKFDFRLAGPITDSDHGFKLGLFEGGDPNDPWFYASGTGYRWNLSSGRYPIPVSLVKESGGQGQKILSGNDSNVINQSSASYSLNDTAKHSAIIILKETDNGLSLSLAIDGGKFVFQGTDLLPPSTLSPTRFAIRSDANTFLLDDFAVDIKLASNPSP